MAIGILSTVRRGTLGKKSQAATTAEVPYAVYALDLEGEHGRISGTVKVGIDDAGKAQRVLAVELVDTLSLTGLVEFRTRCEDLERL